MAVRGGLGPRPLQKLVEKVIYGVVDRLTSTFGPGYWRLDWHRAAAFVQFSAEDLVLK